MTCPDDKWSTKGAQFVKMNLIDLQMQCIHSSLRQIGGVDLQNVTYEIEDQISPTLDLPFYISNNQVMVNVSAVQETGLNTSYDVAISVTAVLGSALLREMTNTSTGRAHTVIHVDGSEWKLWAVQFNSAHYPTCNNGIHS